MQVGLAPAQLQDLMQLGPAKSKAIKSYSSGMKQRLKLGLAILSHSDLLVIDEPFTNLDAAGKKWYLDLIDTYRAGRTLIICSNHQPEEYGFCRVQLEMSTFK